VQLYRKTENYFPFHSNPSAPDVSHMGCTAMGYCLHRVRTLSPRLLVSNPHRVPGVWVINFPFIRNVVMYETRRRRSLECKSLKNKHILFWWQLNGFTGLAA
jgi:hypothetical protein